MQPVTQSRDMQDDATTWAVVFWLLVFMTTMAGVAAVTDPGMWRTASFAGHCVLVPSIALHIWPRSVRMSYSGWTTAALSAGWGAFLFVVSLNDPSPVYPLAVGVAFLASSLCVNMLLRTATGEQPLESKENHA